MKRRSLWKLEVTVPAGADEIVAERLSRTFAQPAASYIDVETGTTTVSLYFERKPIIPTSLQLELAGALNRALRSSRRTQPLPLAISRLQSADWAESWKRHFRPLEIGSRLLIRPSWSRRKPKHGQVLVHLDPGMSFGTGQHPTTGFCLRELAHREPAALDRSFLDLGTGSGILAICAARLGYRPVHALDLDPDAVRIARANARRNGVASRIRFQCRDLRASADALPRSYSLVCANLISDLLLAEKQRLANLVQPGGHLVLAGILQEEFDSVRAAFEALGFRPVRTRVEGEWQSGAFRRHFLD
jgi:ribosomal protein L11 methyltransferase